MTPECCLRSWSIVRRERALVAAICAILTASFVINLALFLTARSGVDIVWSHDARFLRSVQGADSWKAMETARAYARTHSSDLYEQVFFVDAVKFQYPPTALLLFGNLERPALNRISWIATLIAAGLVAVILRKAFAIDWNDDVRQPAAALAPTRWSCAFGSRRTTFSSRTISPTRGSTRSSHTCWRRPCSCGWWSTVLRTSGSTRRFSLTCSADFNGGRTPSRCRSS